MATFTKPYPASSANRAPVWIDRQGQDLLTYYTPRGDPNPSFDRFVEYYTDFVPYNPFTDAAASPPPAAPVPTGETSVSVPAPAPVESPSRSFRPPVSEDTLPPPRIGETAPVILPRVGFFKPLVSETRHGYDNLLTFADGTQKILNNYFLPPLFEPGALAGGAYVFGTVLDPEVATRAGRPPTQKWLYSEAKQGLDRVAYYSDGSSQRAANWYAANPQYADQTGEIPTADIVLADPRPITPANDPTVPPPPPVVPPSGVNTNVGTVAPGGQIVPPGVPTAAPPATPAPAPSPTPPPVSMITYYAPPPTAPRAVPTTTTPAALPAAAPITSLVLAAVIGAFLLKS